MRGEILSESELSFAKIVWDTAPLSSGKLVQLCNEQLGWKKPTTYTMLRNLCQAGFFQNVDATVSVLITEEQYLANESSDIVNKHFNGSISKFVTAFAGKTKLDKRQIEELRRFIEECDD